MAITQVNEVPGLGAKYSLSNGKGIRTYKREWQVLTDDLSTTEIDVLNAVPVARLDVHPRDSLAVCTEVEPDQDTEHGLLWSVKATYTTERNGQNPEEEQENEDNPLNKPYEVRFGFRKQGQIFWKDLDEVAVVNSAGDPYDPPVEIERGIFVIEVTRNEAISPEWRTQIYFDSINADWWRYYRPGIARITDLSGQSSYERGMRFWVVRYQIEINYAGWKVEVLDRGMRVKSTTKQSPAYDEGQIITSPILLNGAGQRNAVSAAPVFINHRGYFEKSFAALSLVF